jgi:hypothetical protein
VIVATHGSEKDNGEWQVTDFETDSFVLTRGVTEVLLATRAPAFESWIDIPRPWSVRPLKWTTTRLEIKCLALYEELRF